MTQLDRLLALLPAGFGAMIQKRGDAWGIVVYQRNADGSWDWLVHSDTKATVDEAAADCGAALCAKAIQIAWPTPAPSPPAASPDPEPPEFYPPSPPTEEFLTVLGVIEAETGLTFPNTHWAIGRCLVLWRLRAHYFHDLFREERDVHVVASVAGCSRVYAEQIATELENMAAGLPKSTRGNVRRRCEEFVERFPEPIQSKAPTARRGKGDENSAEAQGTRPEGVHAH